MTRTANVHPSTPTGAEETRVFLKYTFYKVRSEWRLLSAAEKLAQKREFAGLLSAFEAELGVRCYSLTGIRADADFLLWAIDGRLETFPDIARRIASTAFGAYLDTTYSYLAASQRSIYLEGRGQLERSGPREKPVPAGSRYLFVYPFTKKREWYGLSFEKRQGIMQDHFRIGHRYPSVKIHTGYSFGLDDQEFMLAFETDEPLAFLDLVMELRSSEASRYTERETPIFTCILATPETVLDGLGS